MQQFQALGAPPPDPQNSPPPLRILGYAPGCRENYCKSITKKDKHFAGNKYSKMLRYNRSKLRLQIDLF